LISSILVILLTDGQKDKGEIITFLAKVTEDTIFSCYWLLFCIA